ncbi:alginate lyase family protein [Pseudomonas trivialis]|uniref:Alginate lyase n=1 Tax=Pseudomonas trivialis TaxID=200450 RepID=A0A0R2ZJU1_9PSED|nr:alginate lyase family protein [Pseudomonas trivialis]KRP58659.1 cell wall anchor protein [Pseudomonas trivialis]SDS74253.1 Alginate lyase [Pseudomonas trivialis]
MNVLLKATRGIQQLSKGAVLLGALSVSLGAHASTPHTGTFVHPGLLQTQQDFTRIREKIVNHNHPWLEGWRKLIDNKHASLTWQANPVPVVYRTANGPNNYNKLFNDAAAAYALALRWQISGDAAYADKAVNILDQWASTLTSIQGENGRSLAAGLYGYQLANAGEILRGYPKWKAEDFHRFQNMMLTVFYPINHDFLVHQDGMLPDHHWANWDLANMNSILAIGVLTDRRDLYNEAIDYFKHGAGNGAIEHAVWKLYPEGLGQVQESGRDQAHTMLDIALLGSFCQMAWSQGDDLFGYQNNRVLQGAEYVAKYNLNHEVPFTTFINSAFKQKVISPDKRGEVRPIWELLYNHYVVLKGLNAPYVKAFAQKVQPEGGGGDYGPNSGGYDQLGYGTLLYSLGEYGVTRAELVP